MPFFFKRFFNALIILISRFTDFFTIIYANFKTKYKSRKINTFKRDFEDSLIGLIQKETFHYDLDLKTPSEVITYMCDHLEKLGYSNAEFKQSVLKREEMAATSFVYSFAVPHALNVRSYRPAISVAFLKKPIQWGEFEVKMVILLAIDEEHQDVLRMFFTWLSNMINDANHFASLLETKDYEDFLTKIVE